MKDGACTPAPMQVNGIQQVPEVMQGGQRPILSEMVCGVASQCSVARGREKGVAPQGKSKSKLGWEGSGG